MPDIFTLISTLTLVVRRLTAEPDGPASCLTNPRVSRRPRFSGSPPRPSSCESRATPSLRPGTRARRSSCYRTDSDRPRSQSFCTVSRPSCFGTLRRWIPSPLGLWASSCWVWCNDSASGTAGTSSPAPAVPTCAPRRPGRLPRRASRVCIRGRKGDRSPPTVRTAYPPSSASREQSRGRCRIQPWRMPPRVRPRVEAARSPPGTRAEARTRRERVPSQPRKHAVEPGRRQPAP